MKKLVDIITGDDITPDSKQQMPGNDTTNILQLFAS
jgi:hypothetical protein